MGYYGINKMGDKIFEEIKIKYKKSNKYMLCLSYEDIGNLIQMVEMLDKQIKELEQENREIREWKYVIDNPIDLEKLKELDLIKIKGKEYISKDKIKAKIEELENEKEKYFEKQVIQHEIEILQSLL